MLPLSFLRLGPLICSYIIDLVNNELYILPNCPLLKVAFRPSNCSYVQK